MNEQILFLKGIVEATKGRVVFTQSHDTPYQCFRRRLKRLLGHQPPGAVDTVQVLSSLEKVLEEGGQEISRHRPIASAMELLRQSAGSVQSLAVPRSWIHANFKADNLIFSGT